MSEIETPVAARTPTVYFIDDSATMREVIRIAFRKENIHVITCADAASALSKFGETAPDVVITDVIMPDKDGYEVCQFIKQHEQLGQTPVLLMSGVVNRTVAEKAMAVKADELIRKPFQPQDLIARVKNLLHPKQAGASAEKIFAEDASADPRTSSMLTSLFSGNPAPASSANPTASRANVPPAVATANRPAAVAQAETAAGSLPATPVAGPQSVDIQKLRNEILRLEMLVKKLQAELSAERQYCAALEEHFKTLQERA
jgi:CheY-like chemotaxis protein